MSTSVDTLKLWFASGVKKGATHMVIVCDTFDWEDYPVYVSPKENVREAASHNSGRTMEVYNLSMDMDAQMAEFRAFNY